MSDAKNVASDALTEVRALVYFRGGHLLVTYRIIAASETWDDDLEACARDALSRVSAWPFLWVSLRAHGRVVYRRRSADAGTGP